MKWYCIFILLLSLPVFAVSADVELVIDVPPSRWEVFSAWVSLPEVLLVLAAMLAVALVFVKFLGSVEN